MNDKRQFIQPTIGTKLFSFPCKSPMRHFIRDIASDSRVLIKFKSCKIANELFISWYNYSDSFPTKSFQTFDIGDDSLLFLGLKSRTLGVLSYNGDQLHEEDE